ncbi:MAG: C25 family cysteine peptidase, partial [bacterium]|nr:C25 family cysteine peptidase [bacterium]
GATTTDIKSFIQTAYNTWEIPPEYVLLFGDTSGDYTLAAWETYQIDHPYAQLDGTDILADVAIGRLPAETPANFSLLANYPNPFNASTLLRFDLPEASQVRLDIYDFSGRLVTTLANGWRGVGAHEVTFDGSKLPSGIYLYRLQAGDFTAIRKMVMVK